MVLQYESNLEIVKDLALRTWTVTSNDGTAVAHISSQGYAQTVPSYIGNEIGLTEITISNKVLRELMAQMGYVKDSAVRV